MRRKQLPIYSFLLISIVLAVGYFSLMPRWLNSSEVPLNEFSSERAFNHLKKNAKDPELTRVNIKTELQKLGLEVNIQTGNILTETGKLTYSHNIIAKIKGISSNQSIALLTHYDNYPNTSYGIANSGSGVATILETVRAFLYSKKKHTNDIIIIFTDTKEIGLNGATLFITKHNWAKKIAVAINIDAHGTAGPTYVSTESSNGNTALLNMLDQTAVNNPVGNSLLQRLLKLTTYQSDLSLLKTKGNFKGYNLTILENQYNKQTTQDNLDSFDQNILNQQGAYLLPFLNYFSNTDLKNSTSISDDVFFSIPFGFIHYSYQWATALLYIAIVVFFFLLALGLVKKVLTPSMILKGFLPLLGSFTCAATIAYFGWKILLIFYPQNNDFINGFPYNGHDYIAAFSFLTLTICFIFFSLFPTEKSTANNYVTPLFFGLIANYIITDYDKGGSFLIIPIYCGLIIFTNMIISQRNNQWLNLIMSIPALLIITPFIYLLPILFGLKFLFASSFVITVLIGLMTPVFENWTKKIFWALFFFIIAVGFFIKVNYNAKYLNGKAKPNSLIYVYDVDAKQANWITYDKNIDEWTKKYLGEEPKEININNDIELPSTYNTRFTYSKKAPIKNIKTPSILFLKDSIVKNKRFLKVKIIPNRIVNRYDIFADENMEFINFKANGEIFPEKSANQENRKIKNILCYYVLNNQPLEIEFCIKRASVFDMKLLESSFDLLKNPLFNINSRTDAMIPMPHVLTDAVCVLQTIKPNNIVPEQSVLLKTIIPKITVATTPLRAKKIVPAAVLTTPKPAVVNDSL